MDKNAIKKYAIWARRELIARVSQKAEQFGITEKEIIDERAEKIHGVVLTPAQQRQRLALIRLIRRDSYKQAMEAVAYTWFNRFIALRFMEVNDYLPSHIRALTDEQNAFKPKILSDALNLELTGLDQDKVIQFKESNKTEELYQYLLITLCNHLSNILPGMFQRIDDYTELLFPEHLLREGSVLEQLVAMIPQEDWLDAVQIIGWLYQYYNAEPKDQVFANLKKNIKISKENIPAATQLFTPDWIVRYMVENSLGRLWVEGHPNETLKAGWKYYMEEAEQEPEVQAQLQVIRSEYAQMKPEDILCIDPCSGSGHILVYLFDVLVQIYEAYGYPTRVAVASIVKNNLWGLDIDDRAAQLAYFAVMMKARQYDKGWFRRGIEPHVFALQDSPVVSEEFYARFGDKADAARRVVEAFVDAKEYGSIIQPDVTIEELNALQQVLVEQDRMADYGSLSTIAVVADMIDTMYPLLQQARALVQKYHVVVTNPPYMGASGMGDKLSRFVKERFPDTKSDMSTVFMECSLAFCKNTGLMSMINIPVWMFLSSYEKLRFSIIKNNTYVNMVHPGRGIFGSDFGTTTFVIAKKNIPGYIGSYRRLFDKQGEVETIEVREQSFMEGKGRFVARQEDYLKIPGAPVAYWASSAVLRCFSNFASLGATNTLLAGTSTGDNTLYQRIWYEVCFNAISRTAPTDISKRWYPCNTGGEFRKYTLNDDLIIDWENEGYRIRHHINSKGKIGSAVRNREYFYKSGITWNKLSASCFGVRFVPEGYISDDTARMIVTEKKNELLLMGFLCSKVCTHMLQILSPTMSFTNSELQRLPLAPIEEPEKIYRLVKDNTRISATDRSSFETSWDFRMHPIVKAHFENQDYTNQKILKGRYPNLIQDCYIQWATDCNLRFTKLKTNEEELNRFFIDIYGLQSEMNPEVDDKDVTVRKADLGRDIRSLVSYAVGCLLGRYSIYKDGLMFAGGEWSEQPFLQALLNNAGMQYVQAEGMQPMMDLNPQKVVMPDVDGILPITDDDYFGDDIVTMFVNWVKVVFGANELEENLKFIASALYPNGGGSARELIRQYFLNDFYKDHLKIYQKRPIYWLFDAGKKNSFKCLIYLHRYQPDTVARVRTDYVHEMQARYRTAMEELARRVDTAGGSERVHLQKQLAKIQGQEEELRKYEEKIHHYADMMLPLDLDDGVKVYYAKLADVLAVIK